jgi:hypothetical protein
MASSRKALANRQGKELTLQQRAGMIKRMGGTRIMVIPQSSKLKPGVRFPCTAAWSFNLIKKMYERIDEGWTLYPSIPWRGLDAPPIDSIDVTLNRGYTSKRNKTHLIIICYY